jgi:hypothetical protein
MNYKNAIARVTKEPVIDVAVKTLVEPVIKYSKLEEEGKQGWVKIQLVREPVPIIAKRSIYSDLEEPISLDHFVKLQERRMVEYDSTRWEGAFREMYPLYPPFPEDEEDETHMDSDGNYYSDSEHVGYSDQEY